MPLNDMQQLAADTLGGPVLILAGAGSGKTTALIHRIANILQRTDAPPESVLAITFTNKAAGELRARLQSMLGDDGTRVSASTFHAACVRILRRHANKVGFDNGFNIIDRSDQVSAIKKIIADGRYDVRTHTPASVLKGISSVKDKGLTADEYVRRYGEGDARMSDILKMYRAYAKKLRDSSAMDFDDLLLYTLRLLREYPEVLAYYQQYYRYILVDEYQDTNHAQYLLINMLADKHRNICVVGDDDQSIYKFRGADIRNILDFRKDYPEATVIKLEQNYRSSARIITAANAVIKNNSERMDKSLWTANPGGEPILLYSASDESDEGAYVAGHIKRTMAVSDSGSPLSKYGGYAVLYRINALSRSVEEQLMQNGIPYRVVGGLRFYDRREIRDTLAYCRLAVNPNDAFAFDRCIRVPKRGVADATIAAVTAVAEETDLSLIEVCLSATDYAATKSKAKALLQFGTFFQKIATLNGAMPLPDLISHILIESGYMDMLRRDAAAATFDAEEEASRVANVAEFIASATEFHKQNEGATLADFLSHIMLMSDIDNHDAAAEAVTLMTLHASKGLEFPCVYIVGMEDGIFPGNKNGGVISTEALEEERRLCYVGLTRAKQQLCLSHAKGRATYNGRAYNPPSMFLAELLTHPEVSIQHDRRVSQPMPRTHAASGASSVRKEVGSPKPPVFTQPAQRKRQPPTDTPAFAVGDRVVHRKFGAGTVATVGRMGGDTHYTVEFDGAGTKQLMASFANLTPCGE